MIRPTLLLCLFAASCSGGEDDPPAVPNSGPGPGTGTPGVTRIQRVHNGFGDLLPHRALQLDSQGQPTGAVVKIRSLADVRSNLTPFSGVFPAPEFPTTAIDRNGDPSNHFLSAEFTQPIDPLSIFDLQTGELTDAISLTATSGGATTPVQARVLVGGVTVAQGPAGFSLEPWGQVDPATGVLESLLPQTGGLPGGVSRARLFLPSTVVLIADSDNDLSTLETFPVGAQISLHLRTQIAGLGATSLDQPGLASATVGPDNVTPTIGRTATTALDVVPANGAVGVDPATEILVSFSEPIQPAQLGVHRDASVPLGSGPIALVSGSAAPIAVPYSIDAVSPFDLSTYRLTPVTALPAEPVGAAPPDINLISGAIDTQGAVDMAGLFNTSLERWAFRTGPGAGMVNAPVLPEAVIALGIGTAGPTAMVVDLNGFGASTGNPVSSQPFPLEGESRFPYDPNLAFNPSIRPALFPGTTTVDGGSAGAFTLTLNSNLASGLTSPATVESLEDAHIGHPLDSSFRNAPAPFGCQVNGGDVCTSDGLKLARPILDSVTMVVEPGVPLSFGALNPGYGNLISWAPHPNPPPISLPGLCVFPILLAQEPSWAPFTTTNLLVPGSPFPDPANGTPPTGKASLAQNAYFIGPTPGQTQLSGCDTYAIRQKVGHYLYIANRSSNEVTVLDSNNMTVVERIPVSDPAEFAMSPRLDVLAVVNPLADSVTFIDIDPESVQFHQVIQTTGVGDAPSGAAWSPDNQELIVCNELDDSLSIIEASTLQVRLTVPVPAGEPFQVVMTERETDFGLMRGVYYGYVLSRDGSLSVFESGPAGINGWGYDDVIGTLPFQFQAPKAIQLDLESESTSFVVAHEGAIDPATGLAGALGDGAITRVRIDSGQVGFLPLVAGSLPQFRSINWAVTDSIAESNGRLSGIPVDVAFDEMQNLGALPDEFGVFGAGSPLPANGKGTRHLEFPGAPSYRSVRPRFLLAAIPDLDLIDVIQSNVPFDVNPYAAGTQSIPANGVHSLVTYWRQ